MFIVVWILNTNVIKIINFPVLTHDHVDLDVHLVPQVALNAPKTTKFGFPLNNWAIQMFIFPVIPFLLMDTKFLMTKCSKNLKTYASPLGV